MSAIRTQSLTKIYGGRHIALNGVDLQLEPGAVLGILGNNGAGKTTLVKLLLGLQMPTAGTVKIFGQAMGPDAARLRRRMGYVPAIPRFPAGCTPLTYLDYVGKLQGMPRRERRPRIANLLRAADLQRASGAAIRLLSTGMASKLAIIASLVGEPDLLIWDEPAQGLDSDGRRTMLALLQQLAQKKTLALCSHHHADIRQVCTQLLVLHEGEVAYSGDVDGLKAPDAAAHATLELLGDRKALAEALKLIQETEDIDKAELARTTLRVTIAAGASVTGALTNVLVHLQDKSVEVAEMQLAGAFTERAISQLLHEEGSRGLTAPTAPFGVKSLLPLAAVIQEDLRQGLRHWAFVTWAVLGLAVPLYMYGRAPEGRGEMASSGANGDSYRVAKPQAGYDRDGNYVAPAASDYAEPRSLREPVRPIARTNSVAAWGAAAMFWHFVYWLALAAAFGAAAISSEIGVAGDAVLCWGIARWQYFLGKCLARAIAAMTLFAGVTAPLLWLFTVRAAALDATDDVTFWGAVRGLSFAATALGAVVALAAAFGAWFRSQVPAVAATMVVAAVALSASWWLGSGDWSVRNFYSALAPALRGGDFDNALPKLLCIAAAGWMAISSLRFRFVDL